MYVDPTQSSGVIHTSATPFVVYHNTCSVTTVVTANIAGPQGPPGPSGGDAASWIGYVANYDPTNPPTFVEAIPAGDVYEYTYANGTLYRLVGASNDAFYTTFVSPNISGLVVGRAATI